jgi:hypothetical protein
MVELYRENFRLLHRTPVPLSGQFSIEQWHYVCLFTLEMFSIAGGFLSLERDLVVKERLARESYRVGQEGEFLLYDSFHKPIETVKGKIVKLMDGEDSLYAIIETERGIRPGRLCRSAIRQNGH